MGQGKGPSGAWKSTLLTHGGGWSPSWVYVLFTFARIHDHGVQIMHLTGRMNFILRS